MYEAGLPQPHAPVDDGTYAVPSDSNDHVDTDTDDNVNDVSNSSNETHGSGPVYEDGPLMNIGGVCGGVVDAVREPSSIVQDDVYDVSIVYTRGISTPLCPAGANNSAARPYCQALEFQNAQKTPGKFKGPVHCKLDDAYNRPPVQVSHLHTSATEHTREDRQFASGQTGTFAVGDDYRNVASDYRQLGAKQPPTAGTSVNDCGDGQYVKQSEQHSLEDPARGLYQLPTEQGSSADGAASGSHGPVYSTWTGPPSTSSSAVSTDQKDLYYQPAISSASFKGEHTIFISVRTGVCDRWLKLLLF